MTCPNPKCKKNLTIPLLKYNSNGSDNIDNLEHSQLECNYCGLNFNHWHCKVDKLKEVFGNKHFVKYV